MDAVLTLAGNLGLQLLVAAALAGGFAAIGGGVRKRRVVEAWTWRTLRSTGLPAAACIGAAAVLARNIPAMLAWEPVPMLLPGVATATGALGIGGVVLTWAAGRTEQRGRLTAARRQVRFGGRLAFLGAALQVVLWGAAFFLLPGERQRELVSAGALAGQAGFGALLLGAGGFVLLLAALSGKPRPSGPIGAALYVVGYGALVTAALSLAKLVN